MNEPFNPFSKTVKWRRGASYLKEYYYAPGWFYHRNGNVVGPYKTRGYAFASWVRHNNRKGVVS